jgi:hypothetical protein
VLFVVSLVEVVSLRQAVKRVSENATKTIEEESFFMMEIFEWKNIHQE